MCGISKSPKLTPSIYRILSILFIRYQVVPIIWDDMMRHITPFTLKEMEIGKLVEPMVWVGHIYA